MTRFGMRFYIEDVDNRVREVLWDEWAAWYSSTGRQVARDDLGDAGLVSTIFLSIDHSFSAEGPPLLYETVVFDGSEAEEMHRYYTREEALAGHNAVVARLVERGKKKDEPADRPE